jgi:hypothetical protein
MNGSSSNPSVRDVHRTMAVSVARAACPARAHLRENLALGELAATFRQCPFGADASGSFDGGQPSP